MSKKLEPCPFCGSGNVAFTPDEEQQLEDTTTGFIWCHGCGFSSDSFYSEKIAAEHWNRRAATEANDPLTMEELREMDGEPVWVQRTNKSVRCRILAGVYDNPQTGNTDVLFDGLPDLLVWDSGKTWIAYRRPPEGRREIDDK